MALSCVRHGHGLLCSSLGQTYFISLFSAEIRGELGPTAAFGTYYAIATTASAVTLIWLGKLADSMRVERLALFVISCLCISAFLFSQVFFGSHSGYWALSITSVRAGHDHSHLHHSHCTALCRGASVGLCRSHSWGLIWRDLSDLSPSSRYWFSFNWRSLWMVLPLIPVLFLIPFLRTLTKRTRYPGWRRSRRPDGSAATTDGQPPSTDDIVTINGIGSLAAARCYARSDVSGSVWLA